MLIDPEQVKQLLSIMSTSDAEQMLIADGFSLLDIQTMFIHISNEKSDNSTDNKNNYLYSCTNQSVTIDSSNNISRFEMNGDNINNPHRNNDYGSSKYSGLDGSSAFVVCQRIFRIPSLLPPDTVQRLLYDYLQLPHNQDLMAELVGEMRYMNDEDSSEYVDGDDNVDCVAFSIKDVDSGHYTSCHNFNRVIEFKLMGWKDSFNRIHLFFPSYLLQAERTLSQQQSSLSAVVAGETTMNANDKEYENGTLSMGNVIVSSAANSSNDNNNGINNNAVDSGSHYTTSNRQEDNRDADFYRAVDSSSHSLNTPSSSSSSYEYETVHSRQLEISPSVLQFLLSLSSTSGSDKSNTADVAGESNSNSVQTALNRCVESLREQLPPVVTVHCIEDDRSNQNSNNNNNNNNNAYTFNHKAVVAIILESVYEESLEIAYNKAAGLFCLSPFTTNTIATTSGADSNNNSNLSHHLSEQLQRNLLQLLSPKSYSYTITIKDDENGSSSSSYSDIERVLLQHQRRVCKYLERLYHVSIRIKKPQQHQQSPQLTTTTHNSKINNNSNCNIHSSMPSSTPIGSTAATTGVLQLEVSHVDSEEVLQVAVLELAHLLYPTISGLQTHLQERELNHKIHVFVDISNIEIGSKVVCSLCHNKSSNKNTNNSNHSYNLGSNSTNSISRRMCPCLSSSIYSSSSSSSSSNNQKSNNNNNNNNNNTYVKTSIQLDVVALMEVVTNMRRVVRKVAVGSYAHHHHSSQSSSIPNQKQQQRPHHWNKTSNSSSSNNPNNNNNNNNTHTHTTAASHTTTHSRWSDTGFTVLQAARNIHGKEQLVDETLHAHILTDINKSFPDKRTLVILTGDGNNNNSSTSFPEVIQQALSSHTGAGWRVEVWGWRRGVADVYYEFAKTYPTHFSLFLLDNYREEIIL